MTAKKVSFAWKLKQICHELYGWAGCREPEFYDTPEGELLREVKLERLICDDRPEGLSPRDLWINMGTNAVREQVYQRTWLDYVLNTDFGVKVVIIPDVRFPNEAVGIEDRGGILIKMVRPGFRPDERDVPDHLNPDKALLSYTGWHYVLGASGDIRDLGEQAKQFAESVALFYKGLIDAGMTPEQAYELTNQYMSTLNIGNMFKGMKIGNHQ